jgi:hypothetical protein
MISRLISVHLLLRPGDKSLFCDLIDECKQLLATLHQDGSGALVTTVFGGQFSQPRALLDWNDKGASLAFDAAANDPRTVKLALSTPAIRLAAFTLLPKERALNHKIGALEPAQGHLERGVDPPHLLAQAGEVIFQSARVILLHVQIIKQKISGMIKSRKLPLSEPSASRKHSPCAALRGPPPLSES